MKILILVTIAFLSSCSTNKSNSNQNLLLNRDCNPRSARFSGKDYVQKEQQLNSIAFDQCSKADDIKDEPFKSNKMKNSSKGGALIYKCEVEVNGSSYATSNKILNNARERVTKKCLSYEKSDACSKVRCIEL